MSHCNALLLHLMFWFHGEKLEAQSWLKCLSVCGGIEHTIQPQKEGACKQVHPVFILPFSVTFNVFDSIIYTFDVNSEVMWFRKAFATNLTFVIFTFMMNGSNMMFIVKSSQVFLQIKFLVRNELYLIVFSVPIRI